MFTFTKEVTEILTLKYYLPLKGKIRLYFYENPSKFYLYERFSSELEDKPNNKRFKVTFEGSKITKLELIEDENKIIEEQVVADKPFDKFLPIDKIPELLTDLKILFPDTDFLQGEPFKSNCFKFAHQIKNLLLTNFNVDCRKVFVYGDKNLKISGKECNSQHFDLVHVVVMIEVGDGINANKKIIIDPYITTKKVLEYRDWLSEILCSGMAIMGIDVLPSKFYFLKDSTPTDVIKHPELSDEFTIDETLLAEFLTQKEKVYQPKLLASE